VLSLTVVFADLAGFTAATDIHGDETAADLAARLVTCAQRALATGDRLVKSIGDAVMCASNEPGGAVLLVRRLLDAAGAEPSFPELRVGLHHGPVVERDRDLFGATVNIAARVANHARAGQVLATEAVADAAARVDVGVTRLGQFTFRNVAEPVELCELDLGRRSCGIAIDPVCQMRVERDRAPGRLRHDGVEWWFCSLECAARFAAAPERYIAERPGGLDR
jgi:class 3 adenylate cyclase/YHS domain-containing protein